MIYCGIYINCSDMDLSDAVLADRYKVYRELCRGYYGITWGAFDLSAAKPGNKVCIKVLISCQQATDL